MSNERPQKYQLVCPKCKHEFQYDNGYYDREIARLATEIQDINIQLAAHNKLPWAEKKARQDWWERTKLALSIKIKQISELKSFRKIANQSKDNEIDRAFRNVVKELIGIEAYVECCDKAEEACAAYSIQSTMKKGYTSSTGHGVTNINKIR